MQAFLSYFAGKALVCTHTHEVWVHCTETTWGTFLHFRQQTKYCKPDATALPSCSTNCSSTLSFPQSLSSCFGKLWGWIQLCTCLRTGLSDLTQGSWDACDLQRCPLGSLQECLKWPLNAFGWAPAPHTLLLPRPSLQVFLLKPSDWVAAVLDLAVHEFLWSLSAPGLFPGCPVVRVWRGDRG